METLLKDIRFGLRMLAARPAFTAIAVLTLALGIGANTSIFTLFDALLLESLPVREPARLVLFSNELSEGTFTGRAPTGAWPWFPFGFYEFLGKQSLPLESVCAFRMGDARVAIHFPGSDASQLQRGTMHLVSGNYFSVMGVDAAIGRALAPSDDQPNAAPAAVISYSYWQRRLGSDPAAIGKAVILNGTAFTIVGVAPAEFFGERVRHAPDFWLPLIFQPRMEPYDHLHQADAYWLNMIGRLRPRATPEQAQAAVTVALRQFLTNEAGEHLTETRAKAISSSYIQLHDGSRGVSDLRFLYSQPLHILLAVVGLVLLIASANVGSLLLARAAARRPEISVRLALGAGRGRLIRQMLTESLLLAAIGAVCGLLLAHWGVKLLETFTDNGSPQQPRLNLPVLFFTVGVTVLAGIVFGLAPALQSARTDLVTALKAGSPGAVGASRRLGATRGLMIAQIAVSLVLLVGASLLARTLLNLEHLPLGFDPNNVLLARIDPRLADYKPQAVAALYKQLLDRLSALPGVRAATIGYYSPLSGSKSTYDATVEGYSPSPGDKLEPEGIYVSPDFSKVFGIPLVLGRAIGFQDTAASPKVAMVNETFVHNIFPNQNPIGHRFTMNGNNSYEIVGVMKDAHFQDPREKQGSVVFLSILQEQSPDALRAEIALRTEGDARDISTALRKIVAQTDPRIPVTGVTTLREQVDSSFNRQRLAARFVGSFSALALLLACVGLYGVVAQDVARRRTEIGVRMALGARSRGILWMVFRDTLVLFIGGVLLGIPSAFAASKLISTQLYGLKTGDAVSFLMATAVLGVTAAFAAFVPAHRASRVEPMVALRYE
ncbi:MAG TPA: ABC transporter permease [Candidatus Acidoferrales bacterium]|nr:ABC transporter permease [Candidatus Acidoferrales bacterium]